MWETNDHFFGRGLVSQYVIDNGHVELKDMRAVSAGS